MLRVNQLSGFGSVENNFALNITPDAVVTTWQDSYSEPMDGETSSIGGGVGSNMRQIITPDFYLAASGNQIRLTFASSSIGYTIGDAYIGEQDLAFAGRAYDMKTSSPAPTQIFVNGSGSFTALGGSTIVTDPLNFILDNSKTYVVAFFITAGKVGRHSLTTLPGNIACYTAPSVSSESHIAHESGYITVGPQIFALTKIEVIDEGDIFYTPVVS